MFRLFDASYRPPAAKNHKNRRVRSGVVCSLLGLLGTQLSWAQNPPGAEPLPTLPVVSAAAAPLAPAHRPVSLKFCLESAERNYPKVQEAKAHSAAKQSQLFQAYTAPYSDFTVTGGFGYAPTIQGTAVYSPNSDAALTSRMGLAWNIGVDGAVPLWTFGKISNLWKAAEAQTKVGEQTVRKEKNEVRLSVRRAYYGAMLARDSLALIREAMERIDKHLARIEERLKDGEGDEIDALKLRMYRAELDARESEARKQESIALAGLHFLTGLSAVYDVPDQPLRASSHRLAPLARYLSAARLYRPEINMAKVGVLAREAELKMEQAKLFPDLALGLSARWARAPEISDQRNPFVRDQANYMFYGASIVMRYRLDLLPLTGRIQQAQAELEAMRATERYALGGVGFEVEQAFRESEDAWRRLDAYSRATQYAKRWLIEVQQGIDMGTFEDQDIIDPAKEYALKRFSQMSATFDFNMALAKLALATGWENLAID